MNVIIGYINDEVACIGTDKEEIWEYLKEHSEYPNDLYVCEFFFHDQMQMLRFKD